MLFRSVRDLGKAVYEDFTGYSDGEDLWCTDNAGVKGTCVGNAALAECLCTTTDGFRFIWIPEVQEDTAPDMDAGSLDIGSQIHPRSQQHGDPGREGLNHGNAEVFLLRR